MAKYTIHELANETGVSERSIRAYVDAGLLPRSIGTTRAAYYTDTHLSRLLDIRRLRLEKFSLKEIKKRLDAGPSKATIETAKLSGRRVRVVVEIDEKMWICYEPSGRWNHEANLMEVIESAREACRRTSTRAKQQRT